jgi:hypothetical protein
LIPRVVSPGYAQGFELRAVEYKMSKRFLFCVPPICSWMIGAGLGFGVHTAAAADCLAEPNRDAPEGLHWYYRIDRENDRKCWYLRTLMPRPPESPAVEPQRAARPVARPPAHTAAQRGKPALSESDAAALFLEFLRWKEQQKGAQ